MSKQQTTKKVSKYADVDKARPQRAANYFKSDGHFLFRVLKVEEGEDRFKNALVAAQGTIVYVFEDSDPAANQVGENVAEVIKRNNVAFAGRLKALAMAIGNLTEEDFAGQSYEGEIIDEMVSPEQPGAGVVLEVATKKVLKKDAANKPEPEPKDYYTRVDFVRRVSFAEVKEMLLAAGIDEDTINRRVPNIDAEIAQETAQENGSE